MSNFDEYKILGEPEKTEKAENWRVAIGLQDVDGLKPSNYLIQTAKEHIEGKISIEDVEERIRSYYKAKSASDIEKENTKEADEVSARITKILGEKAFTFSPIEYIGIHRRLFSGVFQNVKAGVIRDYEITKSEWALNGDTVYYGAAASLKETLEYDFEREKKFSYKGLSKPQIIEHIAEFIAYIWQIHIFGEGNTRTTAVFLIKYLRMLGFKNASSDLFAQNSFYFRNALVRANYENINLGVTRTNKYLIMFLENLLLGGNNVLKNRDMQIINNDAGTVYKQSGTANGTVFDLIKSNNTITASEISEHLGMSLRTVKRKIKELKDSGFIKRVGSDKTGSWTVLKGGGNGES